MITQTELKYLLRYDQDTGIFTSLSNRGGKAKEGTIAGSLNITGYIHIRVNLKIYKAHRLAWLYVYGELPPKEIDHINGIRNDNRISNLRLATRSENKYNRALQANNKSGYKGVNYHKPTEKWRASIRINGKQKHLGLYDTPEEASITYQAVAQHYHGDFYHKPALL